MMVCRSTAYRSLPEVGLLAGACTRKCILDDRYGGESHRIFIALLLLLLLFAYADIRQPILPLRSMRFRSGTECVIFVLLQCYLRTTVVCLRVSHCVVRCARRGEVPAESEGPCPFTPPSLLVDMRSRPHNGGLMCSEWIHISILSSLT